MRAGDWLKSSERVALVRDRRALVRVGGRPGERPLLLLHGFPTTSYDWHTLVERLPEQNRTIAFDFFGFGQSDLPTRWSYDEQVELALAVVRREGAARVLVVAHDYGASVAQELIARFNEGQLPFALDGVVFLNGGLNPALHRALLVQRVLAGPLGALLAPLVLRRGTFERSIRRTLARPERFDFAEHWSLVEAMARRAHDQLHYIAERRTRADRWTRAIAEAKCPLGFAWGKLDPVSGEHVLDWVKQTRPDAEVLALAVGHWPQIEAPDEVAAFVDDFARRHP